MRCFVTTRTLLYVGCLALFLYHFLIRQFHKNQIEEADVYLNCKSKCHWTGCMTCKKNTIGADNLFWNVMLLVVIKNEHI